MELGQKVTAPARLYRLFDGKRREWHKPSWARNKPITGIYIGSRTYANGTVEYGYPDDGGGTTFTATSRIEVALIVIHPRQKPVPVLFEDMKAVEE